MSISQNLFTDALRDMQRAMAVFEQPFFSAPHRSFLSNGGSAFSSFFNDENSFTSGNQMLRFPATDMLETPKHYELHAELPGYDKNNIKIELPDDHTLVLSGSVDKQQETKPATEDVEMKSNDNEGQSSKEEQKQLTKTQTSENQVSRFDNRGRQWYVKERVSGSFTRSFSFPSPIKIEDIKASYENGVLKVIVPKSTENGPKIINIE
ncbi:MAG: HSP20-like chaperone [Benjaminiella poitrasii]|nr:MAG: HSP20-like chaperone [Benjaminiella poitrasii]